MESLGENDISLAVYPALREPLRYHDEVAARGASASPIDVELSTQVA